MICRVLYHDLTPTPRDWHSISLRFQEPHTKIEGATHGLDSFGALHACLNGQFETLYRSQSYSTRTNSALSLSVSGVISARTVLLQLWLDLEMFLKM